MKHYDSIPCIKDDGTLNGDMVWGYNKLDGQNFCATYNVRKDKWGPFGSRTVTVDENSEQFGKTVSYFLNKGYTDILAIKVKQNSGKKEIFNGVDEVTFYFEWYGENSFAGKHQEGDDMHLALIDVFIKKKGYIEPKEFERIFRKTSIEIPELIYTGPLNTEIIEKIQNNDWTQENCEFPNVKEGVVFKRSTLLKGQRRPSVKVKTNWWLNKLHSDYPENKWKELE